MDAPPKPPDPLRGSLVARLWAEPAMNAAFCASAAVIAGLHQRGVVVWRCAFRDATGLPCPGCGMTRACGCLLRGDLSGALAWHPLSPLVLGGGALAVAGLFIPPRRRPAAVARLAAIERRLHVPAAVCALFAINSLTRWIVAR